MSNSMIPQYSTMLFTDIWNDVSDFMTDFHNNGIIDVTNQPITDANATTLFYLLYARYGNNPIANRDTTQFKYKIFSVIFQYGPTWQKELQVQQKLRGLTDDELRAGATAIHNQAQNPSMAPAMNAFDPLNYINGQSASHYTKSKVEGYALLLELLKTDVTESFLKKFNICFKRFVSSERPLIYVTEDEEDD